MFLNNTRKLPIYDADRILHVKCKKQLRLGIGKKLKLKGHHIIMKALFDKGTTVFFFLKNVPHHL